MNSQLKLTRNSQKVVVLPLHHCSFPVAKTLLVTCLYVLLLTLFYEHRLSFTHSECLVFLSGFEAICVCIARSAEQLNAAGEATGDPRRS